MTSWLSNLRKKPKHVRNNIAFGSSFGLTLAIALVWFMSGGSTTYLANNDTTKNSPEFFKTLKDGFNKQMASARDALPKTSTSTATTTDRSKFQATPMVATTTTTGQKPVLIEVVHSSSTASSSSSTSSY